MIMYRATLSTVWFVTVTEYTITSPACTVAGPAFEIVIYGIPHAKTIDGVKNPISMVDAQSARSR